jgi:hypothetical protein
MIGTIRRDEFIPTPLGKPTGITGRTEMLGFTTARTIIITTRHINSS